MTVINGAETERRIEIAHIVVSEFQEIAALDFICVGGSTAIGMADAESDLDMIVGYSIIPPEVQRQAAIQNLIVNHGNEPQPTFRVQGTAEGFKIYGVDISIFFGSIEQFMEIPNNREQVMGTHHESSVSEYYDAICLLDTTDTWKRIKSELSVYPVAAGQQIITAHIEKLQTLLQDECSKAIRWKNSYLLTELKATALDYFLRIAYALNNRYYRRPREFPALIRQMPLLSPDWPDALQKCIETTSARSFRAQAKHALLDLSKIVKEVYPAILPT